MGASIYSRLKELEAFRDEVLSGAYPQRTVLGPGTINKNFIKAKSISGSMLDVSELSAVASKTGALTVTGDLIAGSGSSTLGYSPTNGLYIGGATPAASPFKVGTSGALEATGATIGGSISASSLIANSSGQIAGWTIDSAKLSRGNVGIGDSSGYRIWSGNLSSPSLANFSVDNSGNIKAAAGSIAGMTVDSAKMTVNNAGMGSYGGYNLWVGNATPSSAPFRVDTAGNMVGQQANITGAVQATSGSFTGSISTGNLSATGGTLGGLTINGTLTIGSGGQIVWDGGYSYINSGKISLRTSSFGTAMELKDSGGSVRGSIYCSASGVEYGGRNGNAGLSIGWSTGTLLYDVGNLSIYSAAHVLITGGASGANFLSDGGIEMLLGDTGGSDVFYIKNSSGTAQFGVTSHGYLVRPITNDATAVGSYYGRIPIYINGNLKYIAVYN